MDKATTGGQDGVLRIWSIKSLKLVAELENPRRWIDQLAWHPSCNQVAFSLGKKVQIWDAESRSAIAQLDFENSSIFGMAWHPEGKHLAASGSKGVKVWNALRWNEVPRKLEIPSASGAIAWSGDGQRIAVANAEQLAQLLTGASGGFCGLAWHPQGHKLAAGGQGGEVLIWKRDDSEV